MLVAYAFVFVHCFSFCSSATEVLINNNNNNNNNNDMSRSDYVPKCVALPARD